MVVLSFCVAMLVLQYLFVKINKLYTKLNDLCGCKMLHYVIPLNLNRLCDTQYLSNSLLAL